MSRLSLLVLWTLAWTPAAALAVPDDVPTAGPGSAPPAAEPAAPAAPVAPPSAAPATVAVVVIPPPPVASAACETYCDDMAIRCPDVFLGNRGTCLAVCALYPVDEVDIEKLQCRVFGQESDEPLPQPDPPPVETVIGPDPTQFWDDHPQLREDATVVPAGMGAVFLPSLGLDDREPLVTVFDGRTALAEGRPGRRIVVAPGTHTLRFGDGAEHQQVRVELNVEAGRTTVVPAAYAALEIQVVDPQFVPFRGTYELINMDDREVVGLGFGADALLGEQLRVWVLPPGTYKIVQSGGTYRDRTNFSTVRLLPGEMTRFVLVQNPDTGDFEGAGLADEGEPTDRTWNFTGILGGDVVFLRNAVAATSEGWSLVLNVFLDVAARMTAGDHRWVTRLEAEESQTRPSGESRLRNLKDRLFLHTIYTYSLVDWFGPYVRAGLETQILPRHAEFEAPEDVADENGDIIFTGVDRVQIADSFAPLEFIQGTGGNFKVFQSRTAELNLRLGIGARQLVANGLLVLQDGSPDRLVPVKDDHVEGVESTAIGQARVSRWITLSTEFDSLLPFDTGAPFIFTWRNQVNLRLASFASLTYRFNAVQNAALTLEEGVLTEHNLQLRFSYTLF
ncbi:MAG: hypothetical protein H6706_28215 [Myxococcales bacterium]|nr:hypothetical protein [Myxococcales bacterium]